MKLKNATKKKLRDLLGSKEVENIGEELSSSEFLKLWRTAEVSQLLNNWHSLYKIDNCPSREDLIERLKKIGLATSQYSVLLINKDPSILMISVYEQKLGSNQLKFLADEYSKEVIYYLPKQKYFLALNVSETLIQSLFGSYTHKRLRTMDLSKVYNSDRTITYLSVRAVHEISGFHGLDAIIFQGDNVKQGLYGLHKRQDIRVHIDQIGPKVAVSTENFDLKIGANLRIKSLDGLIEILDIL